MKMARSARARASGSTWFGASGIGRSFWKASIALGAALGLAQPTSVDAAPEPSVTQPAPDAPEQAKARKAPVTLAEVATGADAVATALTNATDLLRHDVEAEIAATDWSKAPARRQYLLSASIVRLDAAPLGGAMIRASCTVSVSIREAKGGTLLAILEGRAKVEDAKTASAQAQRDALTGAVKGVMAAVPEALRKAP